MVAELEVAVDTGVGGKEALRVAGYLNCIICRSRRRVGWCDTSARLFK